MALATVIEGENLGAKLIVGDGIDSQGTLGDADLDRVVVRDTIGELAGGRSGIRHY